MLLGEPEGVDPPEDLPVGLLPRMRARPVVDDGTHLVVVLLERGVRRPRVDADDPSGPLGAEHGRDRQQRATAVDADLDGVADPERRDEVGEDERLGQARAATEVQRDGGDDLREERSRLGGDPRPVLRHQAAVRATTA